MRKGMEDEIENYCEGGCTVAGEQERGGVWIAARGDYVINMSTVVTAGRPSDGRG